MRLAVSNIAWQPPDDPAILPLLRDRGVTGIEVAPTKLWPDWQGATPAAAAAYRERLADQGFAVPALQAILFGKPDCTLFDPAGSHRLLEHMALVAGLAASLGAPVQVLGAPGNRRRGALAMPEAIKIAAEVLRRAGDVCAAHGTCLCIEPNPPQFGCDFVTTSAEGAALVRAVAAPGLGLHLDAAGMLLAGEDGAAAIAAHVGLLRHFHASEPDLGGFAAPRVDHRRLGAALAAGGYRGWVSIEMRATADPADDLGRAVDTVKAAYAPALDAAG